LRKSPSRKVAITDVPVASTTADDYGFFEDLSKGSVQGVYASRSGVYELYAQDDEQLKSKLKGLHTKKVDLTCATFTAKGFREADTSELVMVKCLDKPVSREMLSAFAQPRGMKKIEIGQFNSDDPSVLSKAPNLKTLAILNRALTSHDFNNIVSSY